MDMKLIIQIELSAKKYYCVVFPFDCCYVNLDYEWTTTAPIHIGELTQQETIKWIVDIMNHGLVNKVIHTEVIKKVLQKQ